MASELWVLITQACLAFLGFFFHYTMMVADGAKGDLVNSGSGDTRIRGHFIIWKIRLPVVINPLSCLLGKWAPDDNIEHLCWSKDLRLAQTPSKGSVKENSSLQVLTHSLSQGYKFVCAELYPQKPLLFLGINSKIGSWSESTSSKPGHHQLFPWC